MSATGLEVFDRTLQITHIWLNEICEPLDVDKQVAWKVLSTVLHKLRDALPVELSAHLGSQLPLLIRGVYFDQYEPGRQPVDCATPEDFTAEVAEWLSDVRPVDADDAIRTVFAVLARHVSEGQVNKVRQALPIGVRMLWDGADNRMLAEAGA